MALKIGQTSKIPAFLAMQIMSVANDMQAAGGDLIHLEVGQPSTPPPNAVCKALQASLKNTESHAYSVGLGNSSLRQRIAGHYHDWYQLSVDWQKVAITPGSSLGFAISFLSAFDRGDRIAIATPGYPAYRNLMLAIGIIPQLLPARSAQNWMPDLEELVMKDDIPDGLLLASPANPTGVVISDKELENICRWCEKHGVRLIMDEIYHGLTFGLQTQSALAYTEKAIIINSFSKYFCMTGWRLGWIVLPDDIVSTAEKLAQNIYISAATINQLGAIAAFDCYEELNANLPRYQENRDLLCRGLPAEFLGEHAPSDGAFYLYADVSALTNDSVAFANQILADIGVAITPGVDFDPLEGKTHLRLSYAGSTRDMQKAIQRINNWLSKKLPSG
ncbi:aminotransferase class I/II-fold pyridoxal phosphate-dependent enzyme [Candidatus Puniceispirillum sp.]|nr:aminotransferase class I/II-fold pyridoxal phosphate-dependent enzyme [Candidatus Puniceispirillum sp.]